MRILKKNIPDKINWRQRNIFQLVPLMIFASFGGTGLVIFVIFENIFQIFHTETNLLISLFSGILIPVSIVLINKYRKRNGPLYSKVDRNMFNIAYNFTKIKKFNEEKSFEVLSDLFASYSPVQTKKLFKKNLQLKPDINISCKKIHKENNEIKYFILYTLMDIAALDGLYSLKEEEFIENIRKRIGIHPLTFNQLKKTYVKKGLKEERKIIEEQNRQKLINQFSRFMLPYEAYRIMGVSPSATKQQLKKAYRTLAKKHHPDKFAGESEEIIKKAEEKFQELKEAYDVIKQNKKY